MHSFVSSRLDTFNSMLYGVPKHQLGRLQRVQNAAAKLVTKSKKHDHVTPILRELHWLPIEHRIQYKILLMAYKALHNKAPTYLKDLIQVSSKDRTLRSNDQLLLVVPKCRLSTYGGRYFPTLLPIFGTNCLKLAEKLRLSTHSKHLLRHSSLKELLICDNLLMNLTVLV